MKYFNVQHANITIYKQKEQALKNSNNKFGVKNDACSKQL